jgi:Flp pilus assembly pilin Flp
MNKITTNMRIRNFLRDEGGAESAEYTVFALIIFVLVVVLMIPIGDRLEWLWRGLLEILRETLDMPPEGAPAK